MSNRNALHAITCLLAFIPGFSRIISFQLASQLDHIIGGNVATTLHSDDAIIPGSQSVEMFLPIAAEIDLDLGAIPGSALERKLQQASCSLWDIGGGTQWHLCLQVTPGWSEPSCQILCQKSQNPKIATRETERGSDKEDKKQQIEGHQ